MDFYKFAAQVTLIILAVQLIERGIYGAEKKKKKQSKIAAPVVYSNLPAGTALL